MQNVKHSSKKRVIKEGTQEYDKVEQYQADIQAYLDKGDGEQNDGFDGYVDADDFYTTIGEILLQNKEKIAALEELLIEFVKVDGESQDLYSDIFEGNLGYAEYNQFAGLTDPETFTNLGFKVGEELAVLLKAHYVDVNTSADGSYWEGYGNDWADERANEELRDMGLGKVADLIEKIYNDDYYDQDDQDQEYDQDDLDTNSVNKKVSKKKVIKEDNNPDVQDQADCLNGFIEDNPQIDWDYAADYELDCDLNTCLFYMNDDAEKAWPIGDFATDEWDDENDDYVYVDGEELFKDAYRYKFCCGIFYLADELYDFVMKYANGDDPEVAELDAMRNENPDIVYVDWYEDDLDDEDKRFVDIAIKYLSTLSSKFSDLDRVKFEVLKQIANE